MGALWANCQLSKREEDLPSELPFLLMGDCILGESNVKETGFNSVTAIVRALHNGLDRKNTCRQVAHS